MPKDYPFAYKIEIDKSKLPDGKLPINYQDGCTKIDARIFIPYIQNAIEMFSGIKFRGILSENIHTIDELTTDNISLLEEISKEKVGIPIKIVKIN